MVNNRITVTKRMSGSIFYFRYAAFGLQPVEPVRLGYYGMHTRPATIYKAKDLETACTRNSSERKELDCLEEGRYEYGCKRGSGANWRVWSRSKEDLPLDVSLLHLAPPNIPSPGLHRWRPRVELYRAQSL